MGRDVADETFANLQPRRMDGGRLQAFGGRKFKFPGIVDEIGRADFRDHVGRDQHDDLVETLLCAFGFRHDLAQPTEQNARTTNGGRHQLRSRLLRI